MQSGGRVLLLEHVRLTNRWLGALMDVLNPVVVRLIGANTPHLRWVQVFIAGRWRTRVAPICRLSTWKI